MPASLESCQPRAATESIPTACCTERESSHCHDATARECTAPAGRRGYASLAIQTETLHSTHSEHRFPAPSSRKDVVNQCLECLLGVCGVCTLHPCCSISAPTVMATRCALYNHSTGSVLRRNSCVRVLSPPAADAPVSSTVAVVTADAEIGPISVAGLLRTQKLVPSRWRGYCGRRTGPLSVAGNPHRSHIPFVKRGKG